MASGGQKGIDHNLDNIGTLTLEPDDLHPSGVVVVGDKLVITDGKSNKVRVYRRHDGMLMSSSDELESWPLGLCRVNDTDLCVVMIDGMITLMSVQDSGLISRGKTFHLRPSFDVCFGVAAFRDNVVVSGVKDKTICWCVVSLQDGRHDNLHKVCGWGDSRLTTKENMAYVSCGANSDDDIGVYGFNLLNPSQPPYIYKHKGLSRPRGITVDDNGDLFVCDKNSHSIHHLTEKCQLVDIYTEGIPRGPFAIFWDSGILYVASWMSNVITLYKTPHQDLPAEILRMDEKSKQLFKEALKKGEEKVYNIRVMVVGHGGVGKTTLIKRLLGKNVNIKERCATEGIDIDMHCCDVSVETFEWKVRQTEDRSVRHRLKSFFGRGRSQKMHAKNHSPESEDTKEDSLILRVAKVVNEETWKTKFSLQAKQENHPSRKHPDQTKRDGGIRSTVENQVTIIQEQNKSSESKQECISTAGGEKHSKPAENKNNISEVRGNLDLDFKGDTLHSLLCEKAPKLPQSTDEHASLAVWDFAGQYAFYTTHQTFMTRRAIYLLVLDVSEKFDNPVDDECYLDSRGKIQCHVRDLVEVWMNSIHSCSSSPEEGIPPVILVGTHVDRIKKAVRHEVCERYFKEVRTYLKDKPSRFHLVNEEFAIDNTVVDSKLENLKKKIVQVASQQTYWGEKIPAQWLPLEQALMKLRRDGKKVIPRSVLEDLAATHEIATDQLELFLRFQHDIGMILYFSIDILKEKIVLDTKWMIDALKSLINADDMEVMRNNPKLSSKVSDFKKYGILCPDLIDAIWTKEQYKEFHGNKEHVLLLMGQLNIIARPTSYVESNVKEENYFLAPCMLQQKTPEEIICPEPNDQMESSPIMCYVFVGNFLPSPIFHRLVAACIAHWPIAKKKTEMIEENLIFCGCCMFQLNEQHKLTLHFREHVIFLRVTRMGIKEKTPSSKLCIEVREFITTNLNNIIGYLGQSLKFEYFIQCPEYSGVSISSMIPVSRLKDNAEVRCDFHGHMIESCKVLDFWYEDQEQSGDSDASSVSPMPPQPSGDTDRFMHITYLLVDIGARVLRQLLRHHTVTSTCTLDQYLAKYSNTFNKLTKVFNKSLMAIMFPPNGSDTNLDDYDITLLSALFNNIVPSLSKQEKDLIQKLRDDRNKLFAHAKSCQINASDFQTHWNDISSTLITLSQQCRDTAFEAKILQEIQHSKISAIPAGSYLDLLKSLFDMIETVKDELQKNFKDEVQKAVKDELQNVTSRLQALESKEQSSASEL